jgi:hypothetical protein
VQRQDRRLVEGTQGISELEPVWELKQQKQQSNECPSRTAANGFNDKGGVDD